MTSNIKAETKRISYEEFEAFESIIDTRYFGIPSGKVVLKNGHLTDRQQNELLIFLQEFEFVTITNKTNNPLNNRWLGEKTKAFLTDVNVQFSKKVLLTEKYNDEMIVVADNFPKNERIIRLANTSFGHSRFLNDPYLPAEKAKCIYGDITKNAFNNSGRFFVIAKMGDNIAGFILFSIGEYATAIINLIAIDKAYQGKGVGKSLIKSMEYSVSLLGAATIIVGTQLNNLGAFKFYTSCGFNYFECNSIYHYWPQK